MTAIQHRAKMNLWMGCIQNSSTLSPGPFWYDFGRLGEARILRPLDDEQQNTCVFMTVDTSSTNTPLSLSPTALTRYLHPCSPRWRGPHPPTSGHTCLRSYRTRKVRPRRSPAGSQLAPCGTEPSLPCTAPPHKRQVRATDVSREGGGTGRQTGVCVTHVSHSGECQDALQTAGHRLFKTSSTVKHHSCESPSCFSRVTSTDVMVMVVVVFSTMTATVYVPRL